MAALAITRRLVNATYRSVGQRTIPILLQQQQLEYQRVFPKWFFQASTFCTVSSDSSSPSPEKPKLIDILQTVCAGDFDGASSMMEKHDLPLESQYKTLLNRYFKKKNRMRRSDEEDLHFLTFISLMKDEDVKKMNRTKIFKLLQGAAALGHTKAANMLFNQLKETEATPDAATYGLLLVSYCNESKRAGVYDNWSHVERIFSEMDSKSLDIRDSNIQDFIDYSVQSGHAEEARVMVVKLPNSEAHLTYLDQQLASSS